ncbi:hypothetical protein D3C81_2040100 [compost metagenome]
MGENMELVNLQMLHKRMQMFGIQGGQVSHNNVSCSTQPVSSEVISENMIVFLQIRDNPVPASEVKPHPVNKHKCLGFWTRLFGLSIFVIKL